MSIARAPAASAGRQSRRERASHAPPSWPSLPSTARVHKRGGPSIWRWQRSPTPETFAREPWKSRARPVSVPNTFIGKSGAAAPRHAAAYPSALPSECTSRADRLPSPAAIRPAGGAVQRASVQREIINRDCGSATCSSRQRTGFLKSVRRDVHWLAFKTPAAEARSHP